MQKESRHEDRKTDTEIERMGEEKINKNLRFNDHNNFAIAIHMRLIRGILIN